MYVFLCDKLVGFPKSGHQYQYFSGKSASLHNYYVVCFVACVMYMTSGDSRLSIQGGHYSKVTFIVRPLHITLHFLHLYILKIGIKLHVRVLKMLGLAMPRHIYVNISSRFSTTFFTSDHTTSSALVYAYARRHIRLLCDSMICLNQLLM